MKKVLLVLALLGAAIMMIAPPTSSGVIHEIVAQWCAGKGELVPPGLSREGSKNFAQPVASTLEEGVVPFDPPGAQPAGFLLVLDYDAPPSKGEGNDIFVVIGSIGAAPLYLELFDLSHPAFDHCKNLRP
jgi:hypothetical protein